MKNILNNFYRASYIRIKNKTTDKIKNDMVYKKHFTHLIRPTSMSKIFCELKDIKITNFSNLASL
jgi:hypothetical protein